jgi:DNA polymerase-3 subunit delta
MAAPRKQPGKSAASTPSGAGAATGSPTAPPRVVLLVGAERFLMLDNTARLRTRLSELHAGCDVFAFDGSTCRAADVLDECRSMGLMTAHKLVVVDNCDALLRADDDDEGGAASSGRGGGAGGGGGARRGERSAREMFEAYAHAPESSATLVLRAEKLVAGNLGKAIEAGGGLVVKCDTPEADEAQAFALQRAKQVHAIVLSPAAASRLVQTVGSELGRIDTELAKLALVAAGRGIGGGGGGGGALGPELIDELTGASREEDIWAMQASLLGNDAGAALKHLHELLTLSRQSPAGLSFAFADLARKLDAASRALANRESEGQVSSRLRLWGASKGPFLAKAHRVPPARASALFADAVDTDWRIKSGRGEPVHLLEVLTLKFVHA